MTDQANSRPARSRSITQTSEQWRFASRIARYCLPYWRQGLVVLACILIGSGLNMVPALVTKVLIDSAFRRGADFRFIVLVLVGGVLAVAAGALIGVVEEYFSLAISESIIYTLRKQMFERLLNQSINFFSERRLGDIISRLTSDISGIQAAISDTIFGGLGSLAMAIGTLAFMIILDWRLAIATVLMIPIYLVPARRVGKISFRARDRTQAKLAEITSYLQDRLSISGVFLIKSFGRKRQEAICFDDYNQSLRSLETHQAMVTQWFHMVMEILMGIGPLAFWLLGGYLIVTGQATAGTVITFAFVLVGRFQGAVGLLSGLHVRLAGVLALFHRLFEYLDEPVEVDEQPKPVRLKRVVGKVEFDHVTMTYSGSTKAALTEVTFSVESGELVALVGPSGAGKTTATMLLARFYDPDSGAIRVDGVDVRKLSLETLAESIGIVFQDTFLFNDTLRENLLYARPNASEQEMETAVRIANLDNVVRSLPTGYDTIVGEQGHRLSAGERQRIAIARVVLKDPQIIIFDEATSNLDSESEFLIQAAMQPLFKKRTSLVIAHRLSTVMAADRILVFDRGLLVGSGTHAQLLEKNQTYANLYARQFTPIIGQRGIIEEGDLRRSWDR